MVGSSRGQIAGFLAEVRALPKSVGGSLARLISMLVTTDIFVQHALG